MRQWTLHKKLHHRTRREVSKVCYEDVGCFEDTGPFSYLEMLPSPPKDVGTRYMAIRKSTKVQFDSQVQNDRMRFENFHLSTIFNIIYLQIYLKDFMKIYNIKYHYQFDTQILLKSKNTQKKNFFLQIYLNNFFSLFYFFFFFSTKKLKTRKKDCVRSREPCAFRSLKKENSDEKCYHYVQMFKFIVPR